MWAQSDPGYGWKILGQCGLPFTGHISTLTPVKVQGCKQASYGWPCQAAVCTLPAAYGCSQCFQTVTLGSSHLRATRSGIKKPLLSSLEVQGLMWMYFFPPRGLKVLLPPRVQGSKMAKQSYATPTAHPAFCHHLAPSPFARLSVNAAYLIRVLNMIQLSICHSCPSHS